MRRENVTSLKREHQQRNTYFCLSSSDKSRAFPFSNCLAHALTKLKMWTAPKNNDHFKPCSAWLKLENKRNHNAQRRNLIMRHCICYHQHPTHSKKNYHTHFTTWPCGYVWSVRYGSAVGVTTIVENRVQNVNQYVVVFVDHNYVVSVLCAAAAVILNICYRARHACHHSKLSFTRHQTYLEHLHSDIFHL